MVWAQSALPWGGASLRRAVRTGSPLPNQKRKRAAHFSRPSDTRRRLAASASSAGGLLLVVLAIEDFPLARPHGDAALERGDLVTDEPVDHVVFLEDRV